MEAFLKEGASVSYCARTLIPNQFEHLKPDNILGVQCDISDSKQVEQWFDSTIKEFGTIDILVHNGIQSLLHSIWIFSPF